MYTGFPEAVPTTDVIGAVPVLKVDPAKPAAAAVSVDGTDIAGNTVDVNCGDGPLGGGGRGRFGLGLSSSVDSSLTGIVAVVVLPSALIPSGPAPPAKPGDKGSVTVVGGGLIDLYSAFDTALPCSPTPALAPAPAAPASGGAVSGNGDAALTPPCGLR